MNWSYTRSWCQCLTLIYRLWGGATYRIFLSLGARWVGRHIAMLTMYTTQPSRTWQVDHEQSPEYSFLNEGTSFLLFGYNLSKGLKNLPKLQKWVRRTWRHRWVWPCANSSKSSTKTSTYTRSRELVGRRRRSWDKGPRVGYNVVDKVLTSADALLSSLCDRKGHMYKGPYWDSLDLSDEVLINCELTNFMSILFYCCNVFNVLWISYVEIYSWDLSG